MPQNQTTPEKTLSNPWHGKGFCEINQYKSALDRGEGGYKSLDIGIDMFKRLQKITEEYSAALREWSKTSQKHLAESKEFGTTKKVWLESIRNVEKLADQNDVIAAGVEKNVVEKMTTFKNNNYGKSFIHVKKVKEFEHEFKKAQKPWTDFLEKINDAKQGYQDAKRKLRQAEGQEEAIKSDVSSTDDEKRKVKSTVEKRRSDANSCKSKYQRLVDDVEAKKENYQKEMFAILEKNDTFEKKRLEHFNSMFIALRDATVIDNTEHHTKMTAAFKKTIDEHDIDGDIEYFNTHYGRKTTTKWPEFEDLKD